MISTLRRRSWIGRFVVAGVDLAIAAIYAARRQTLAVHGLLQNARDFLRECDARPLRAARKDSFRWLGTYAPMKTPLRFAISRGLSFSGFE